MTGKAVAETANQVEVSWADLAGLGKRSAGFGIHQNKPTARWHELYAPLAKRDLQLTPAF